MGSKWVIFTDLDGTLLDGETYAFDAARPALDEIRRLGIPLVFCTTKTAAETRHYQKLIGVDGPFIVENGAGIYAPKLVELAARYDEVRRGMERLKILTGGSVRGFGDMTVDEVATLTGVPRELAELAKQREFDEPFVCLRDVPGLEALAAKTGLRVSRGGRFRHLHGDIDKGRAVAQLKTKYPGARTMGLGDSPLDGPMLEAVDVPIWVKGPGDWNRAVLDAIR